MASFSPRVVRSVSLAAVLLLPALARPLDWPQWRGPNRDGVVPDFEVPKAWPRGLGREWQVTVGEGHSSPALADGRLYVLAREKDDEVVRCLDAGSGKELWRAGYPAPYQVNPAAAGHGKGPKATPAVQGGRVYTFGISGILSCLDARTGEVRWRKDFAKEYPKTSPLYGVAASPLIENGLCVVPVGGHGRGALAAFDADTGAVKWAWPGDGPGYSSPVAATLAGERQVVVLTQDHVVGVSLDAGKLLWEVAFKTAYEQNIITPVVYEDLVIFGGVGQPTTALRIEKRGGEFTAREAWSAKGRPMYMSSPVLAGRLLFGMTPLKAGQLFCLDAGTGKVLWENDGRMGSNVSIVRAGDVLALLTNEGRLIMAKAGGDRYEELARYTLADSPTWAHPVLSGKRIWVKGRTAVTCWSLGS
jgi:outer membrane protein assembly factor BamB